MNTAQNTGFGDKVIDSNSGVGDIPNLEPITGRSDATCPAGIKWVYSSWLFVRRPMVQVVGEKDSLHQRLVFYVLSVPELLHNPMRQINIEQGRTVPIISES